MKAAVMNGALDVSVVEMEKPVPKEGEVLLAVKSCGVCGSDMHYYIHGEVSGIKVQTPFILGHEVAGQVVELGPNVKNLKVGDRVAVEAGIPCGTCEHCRTGHYNRCDSVKFLATPPYDGAFVEYMAYPEDWLFKLPDDVSYTAGALIEPLAVGIHASELAGASLGETAFVYGCGCIGLVTLMALKARGVSKVYMSDRNAPKRAKALELGATAVLNPNEVNIAEEIYKLTDGRGVDSVYEMTGSEAALLESIDVVRKGGCIVLVGLGQKTIMPFDFCKQIWKEVEIKSCFRYKNIYPKAINAISAGILDIEKIVSHTVTLDEAPEGLKFCYEHKKEVVKMVVKIGD